MEIVIPCAQQEKEIKSSFHKEKQKHDKQHENAAELVKKFRVTKDMFPHVAPSVWIKDS